jgi:antitoxin CptB
MRLQNKDNLSRLAWSCRRGMLELDVLLGKFLRERYVHLTTEEQSLFEQLLSMSDVELFSWLVIGQKPTNKNLLSIVELIRGHI